MNANIKEPFKISEISHDTIKEAVCTATNNSDYSNEITNTIPLITYLARFLFK
jgi:hypothetical protein